MSFNYGQIMIGITVVWLIVRVFVGLKNKTIEIKYECKLLTVYASIALVTRLVYFPLIDSDGSEVVFFYTTKYISKRLNLIPFAYLKAGSKDWALNVLGNIALFIPVGITWPLCYKKLDKVWKVVLAGAGYSLLIEISQMFVFGRETDIDDLMTNTLGAFIGALIYFGICALRNRRK